MEVYKSTKVLEEYSEEKIKNGICEAYTSAGEECQDDVISAIVSNLYVYNKISTKEIRRQVEESLMSMNKKVARAYMEKFMQDNELDDRLSYINKYVKGDTNAATASETDANANVLFKNVANLDGEVHKVTNRKIQRRAMKNQLAKQFPSLKYKYEKDLEHHIIYQHDEASSSTIKNYCEAVSLYPLLLNGTGPMDGVGTTPPKTLNAFCGQLVNLTFLLSSQCKGAVAFGGFFVAFNYYCVKEWGKDYYKIDNEYSDGPLCKNRKTIKKEIEQAFQFITYGWNQPAGNRSYQSPFTNISYYCQNYFNALFKDFLYPDGTAPKWEAISYLQILFMKWFNAERSKTLLTFPVETMALLSDGKDIIDKKYKELNAEMYAEGHSFFTYISDNPNGLASCCRLCNKIEENVFSFTNGLTGIQTGSCNVITLNIARIIQDWYRKITQKVYEERTFEENMKDFSKYLGKIVERVQKYHIAYKTMLYDMESAKMLTSSNAGYISMRKLYSTVGVNGLNEAALFLRIKCNYNDDYKLLCQTITGTISDLNKQNNTKDYKFNQEFVPAEGLSSKNYNWDKEDGYWVPNDRNLYNSYFYDAHDNTSILEKLKLHGREFTSRLDGGVGCHINLLENLSKQQYLDLMDYALKVGTTYYTFNCPQSQCMDCKTIYKHPITECPHCHSKNIEQWTRVIGFLRPINAFDKYRHEEALHRTYLGGDNLKKLG